MRTILIVDDDASMRFLLKMLFESAGYQCRSSMVGFDDLVARTLEEHLQQEAHARVVVDDQDRSHRVAPVALASTSAGLTEHTVGILMCLQPNGGAAVAVREAIIDLLLRQALSAIGQCGRKPNDDRDRSAQLVRDNREKIAVAHFFALKASGMHLERIR